MQSPELETRLAILKKKIKNDGIDIPYEVIEYIAYSITTNIRELEGSLISLLAQASLNSKSNKQTARIEYSTPSESNAHFRPHKLHQDV